MTTTTDNMDVDEEVKLGEDVIISFRNRPFKSRSSLVQREIVKRGRPTPTLKNLKKENKCFTRTFNPELYEKTTWLCGSEVSCRLYCWPCLLFSKDRGIWCNAILGYSDLNNVHSAIWRHQRCNSHVHAVFALHDFETVRFDRKLDKQKQLSIAKHNEQVTKNRDLLRRFIDITRYLGTRGRSFGGHNENAASANGAEYADLVHLLAEYDEKLKHHLETTTVTLFKAPFNEIQDNTIHSIGEVLFAAIKSEIEAAQFVAIMMNDCSDESNYSCQLSTVFRYVSKQGEIIERFVGFSDATSDRKAESIVQFLCNQIGPNGFSCDEKVVAHTYDGAVGVKHGELQRLVKLNFPNTLFVHCNAHQLNEVLSQGVSYAVADCRIFFTTLEEFISFFSKSIRRLDALVEKLFPKIAATRRDCRTKIFSFLLDTRTHLESLFECILCNPEGWAFETVGAARNLAAVLTDFKFNFLLRTFQPVFEHTETLCSILQANATDVGFCCAEVARTTAVIRNMRGSFGRIWEHTEWVSDPHQLKRYRTESGVKDAYQKLFQKIIETTSAQLVERFADLSRMKFVELLDTAKFRAYAKAFPEEAFAALQSAYGRFFDALRLRTELSASYESGRFNKVENVTGLCQNLIKKGLTSAVPEVYKLCCLVLTLPATPTSVEAGSASSTLKRIRAFARNERTGEDERMSKLAVISIEKELLDSLVRSSGFYDQVIDVFIRKSTGLELTYAY